ncbi:MAG: hypothetical protein ACTSWQ_00905 [Candidatus Thorarchaeota archaeon]
MNGTEFVDPKEMLDGLNLRPWVLMAIEEVIALDTKYVDIGRKYQRTGKTVAHWLKMPEVQEYIKLRRENHIEVARQRLQRLANRSVEVFEKTLGAGKLVKPTKDQQQVAKVVLNGLGLLGEHKTVSSNENISINLPDVASQDFVKNE